MSTARFRKQPGPGHELDRHLDFQRREWRVQRIGWWAIAAFLVAALLGLFGGGPLSSAAAQSWDGSLRVEYQRFVRAGAAHRLTIRARTSGRDAVELRLDRAYFAGMRLERVLPEPLNSSAVGGIVTFRFPSGRDVVVTLDCEPLEPGSHAARIALKHGAAVTFRQFAYF